MVGCNSETTTTTTTGLDYDAFDYLTDYNQVFTRREGTYFVYFYSLTCSNCIKIKSSVLEFADTYSDYNTYFFNVDNGTDTYKAEFLAAIGVSSTNFGTPSFLVVVNGSFDKTKLSNYFFSGATVIPALLRDIETGTYQYLK